MPKEKYEAKQAIKDEKKGDAGDKYSVEALRANMSTGGGEPIAKGKKMTNEKRVLQPRDPDTGHFTYNADAQYGLKYKQRAKGAVPVGARNWVLNDGIKKGDKVNINDKVWIAIADMDKDAVIDYFKKFDENSGEYYTEKKNTADDEGPFTKNQGVGEGFSSNFIRKRGRPSKEEKQGVEQGERIVGNLSAKAMNALSKTSKQEMADKFAEKAKGIVITDYSTVGIAPVLSGAKLTANQLHNAAVSANKSSTVGASTSMPNYQSITPSVPASAGAGAGAAPQQQAQAKPMAPVTPTAPKNTFNVGTKSGTISFGKGQLPSKDSLLAGISKLKKK